jgi:hypothetical protein
VLKKAGIIVAASAVSLLAVSPLAFAGEKDGGDHVSFEQSRNCTNEQANVTSGNFLPILNNLPVVNIPITCVNILGVQQVGNE